jgi:pilus assembly protein CpaB
MKAPKYLIIVVALVCAVLLALLARNLMSGSTAAPVQAQVQVQQEPMVKVLVAARELKAGERIAEADLTWLDWPAKAKSPAFRIKVEGPPVEDATIVKATEKIVKDEKVVADVKAATEKVAEISDKLLNSTGGMEDYIGGMVREDIALNEPIIDAKIVRAKEGGYMAAILRQGQRALAVPISVESTAGGFILPGDRVDIVLSYEPKTASGSGNYIAETILRNVLVLAIDQASQAKKDQQSVIGATATLAVTPEQGQILAQSKAMGSLSLMLRSYADFGTKGAETVSDRGSGGRGNSVRVFRNGELIETTVSR